MFSWIKSLFRPVKSEEFTCNECGQMHDEWPALTFDSPCHYNILSSEAKELIAEITPEFCIIKHDGQIDRFIRVVLIQNVNNSCQDLHYGLWVSLSEKSFADYQSKFSENSCEELYFGWLSNNIPEYDETIPIKTNVYTQADNGRPEIVIHSEEYEKHPFAKDYFDGISKKEAIKRIKQMPDLV